MNSETFKKLLEVYVRLVSYNATELEGETFEDEERMLREVIDDVCEEAFSNRAPFSV